jgi:RNA recognition motif-containing protein
LICFTEHQYAEAAVTELNTTELNGRQIHLRIDSEGEADPEGSSSIYVGNLPWQVTDDELNAAFSRFKPYSCRVMKNMSGRSRGFAILKFIDLDHSQAAITAMHKYEIGGRAIEVSS